MRTRVGKMQVSSALYTKQKSLGLVLDHSFKMKLMLLLACSNPLNCSNRLLEHVHELKKTPREVEELALKRREEVEEEERRSFEEVEERELSPTKVTNTKPSIFRNSFKM